MSKIYDMVVLGGGAAGLTLTLGAASLGARVALVEKHKLGGDCLNYGCVPSKALVRAAHVAHTARQAQRFGVDTGAVQVDLARVMDYVQSRIDTIGVHDRPENFEQAGAEVLFGSPRLLDSRSLDLNGTTLRFKNCAICTGSSPFVPPPVRDVPHHTNETIFGLRELPERLLVLGGGPIGCELSQCFARFGSRVTLVQRGDRVLRREDPEASQVIQTRFRNEGMDFRPNLTLQDIPEQGTARFKDAAGAEVDIGYDVLLVATGRQANVEGLNLEAAGVRLDERGYILTDDRLRTTASNIWAAGDVHGGYQFTHVAEHEAKHVLPQALFRLPVKPPYHAVPWATFTDPEVARVGLNEQEARQQNIEHQVWRFSLDQTDRAITEGETEGFFKMLTGPKGRIIGATIVSPQAGELIHEFVLAMERGLKPTHISMAIHVYPTLALGARRAADNYTLKHLAPEWVMTLAKKFFGYDTSRSPGKLITGENP